MTTAVDAILAAISRLDLAECVSVRRGLDAHIDAIEGGLAERAPMKPSTLRQRIYAAKQRGASADEIAALEALRQASAKRKQASLKASLLTPATTREASFQASPDASLQASAGVTEGVTQSVSPDASSVTKGVTVTPLVTPRAPAPSSSESGSPSLSANSSSPSGEGRGVTEGVRRQASAEASLTASGVTDASVTPKRQASPAPLTLTHPAKAKRHPSPVTFTTEVFDAWAAEYARRLNVEPPVQSGELMAGAKRIGGWLEGQATREQRERGAVLADWLDRLFTSTDEWHGDKFDYQLHKVAGDVARIYRQAGRAAGRIVSRMPGETWEQSNAREQAKADALLGRSGT